MTKHFIVAALLLTSCAPAGSRTSPLAGSLGRQCQLPVHVKCDVSLGDLCGVTESAVSFWNAQLPGVRLFSYDGTFQGAAPFTPATIYVTDADTHLDPIQYALMDSQGVIGYTPSRVQEDGSENTGCIIMSAMFLFRAKLNHFPVALQENTVRHELGHALGLSHNEWDSASVMYPQAHLCVEPLSLRAADWTQLKAIYGRH